MQRHLLPWDIETRPDFEAIRELYEFIPELNEFDPASVKTGNMSDPQKIREKVYKAECQINEPSDRHLGI